MSYNLVSFASTLYSLLCYFLSLFWAFLKTISDLVISMRHAPACMNFDRQVLGDLAEWMHDKRSGRVPVKDLDEFYQESAPHYRNQLHNHLHLLADCAESKVHLVLHDDGVKYLEMKEFGTKPYQGGAMPDFIKKYGFEYAVAETAAEVRMVLEVWQKDNAVLAFDFKGKLSYPNKKIALVQIATMDHRVLLAYTKDNARFMEESGLKDFFEDERRVKVVHRSSPCVKAAREIYGVRIVGVFDLIRGFVITKLGKVPSEKEEYDNHQAGLVKMLKYHEVTFPFSGNQEEPWTWLEDPLSEAQLEYAACGAAYYCDLYGKIMRQAESLGLEQACFKESATPAAPFKKTPSTLQVDGGKPPPPSIKESKGNTIDWMCPSCKAANLAKHTMCAACKQAKPKAEFLVPVVPAPAAAASTRTAAAPAAAAASTRAAAAAAADNNKKEVWQEQRTEMLKELGLTSRHCFYFHVKNHCHNDKPGQTCGYIHDHESKALQARELAAKNPVRTPASLEQMGARTFQEPKDEALERAIKESWHFEEERKKEQYCEQEKQFARRRAGTAPQQQQQAQLSVQQPNFPALTPAPIAAAATPSLAQSSANNDRALLTREITLLCQQLKISEQYIPVFLSCAQASGAQSELKEARFNKLSSALKNSDMPLTVQKNFAVEVHARITGKQ